MDRRWIALAVAAALLGTGGAPQAQPVPGLTSVDLTLVDAEATLYATFQSNLPVLASAP